MKKRHWYSWVTLALIFTLVIGLYQPTEAQAASAPDYKIEINKKTNYLYLYNGKTVVKTYRVATGKTKALTPEGTFPLAVKIVKPGWKGIPGGDPKNPLGERWNGISVNGDNGRIYGIHGTNNPKSIGTHASSGCVRMKNSDVIDLYSRVYEGTPIWIHSGKSNKTWRGNASVGLKPASGTLKTTTTVNARTGPSTGSFIVTTLKAKISLSLIGKSGDWYQVQLSNGRKVFVHKNYSTVSIPTPPNSGKVTVFVDVANIRSTPSMSGAVVGKAKKGTSFVKTGMNGDWNQVKLSNGKTAYLHKTVAK
ncbi:L,D-transpeptidase family protein [Baia soyae]|uniref:SH3 domain-containing protein n=1 Tax=Baia soyae TaxID=1544746 RepID=A0A4R2RRS1_9BACL|nr:L,D-transpeptidase family protein [Baia soyae]TCP62581.1 SH3 domain-containing protein [Baia soyae]